VRAGAITADFDGLPAKAVLEQQTVYVALASKAFGNSGRSAEDVMLAFLQSTPRHSLVPPPAVWDLLAGPWLSMDRALLMSIADRYQEMAWAELVRSRLSSAGVA
jgi:hypothetical protein